MMFRLYDFERGIIICPIVSVWMLMHRMLALFSVDWLARFSTVCACIPSRGHEVNNVNMWTTTVCWFNTNGRPSPDTIYRRLNKYVRIQVRCDGCQPSAAATVSTICDAMWAQDVAAIAERKYVGQRRYIAFVVFVIITVAASHFIQ